MSDQQGHEINDLASAAAGGDADAFETLAWELHDRVYYYLIARVRDPTTTEDLVQETWLRVARNIRNFQPGTNFLGWLFTIARNLTIDHFRAQQRKPAETLQADMLALTIAQPGADVEETAERRALAEAVAGHLDRLRPEQRQCLILRFFAGLTSTETAEAMGKTPGAVRILQSRALKRLAK